MIHQVAKNWDEFQTTSFTMDFVIHLSHTSLVLASDVLEMMVERQEEMETGDTNQANDV